MTFVNMIRHSCEYVTLHNNVDYPNGSNLITFSLYTVVFFLVAEEGVREFPSRRRIKFSLAGFKDRVTRNLGSLQENRPYTKKEQ